MNKNDYMIRLEKKEEQHKVEHLVREAFWNVYRPRCLEHYVLHHTGAEASGLRQALTERNVSSGEGIRHQGSVFRGKH